jgi:diguanylate cyclase (GGDEF)-like protein/PAS domain S-box-containing protein
MQLPSIKSVDVNVFFQKVHPADRSAALKQLSNILENGEAEEFDFRVSIASGGYRHVHLISKVTRDQAGNVARVSGTCQDITEVKNIESSLQKLSSAITHSGSSVLITDVIGAIEYVNPKFSETTGYSLDEVKGQQPELLSRKWISADRYESLWQSILSGQHWRGELQSRRKDGSTFWSLVSISPIHNEYNELTHFVIVCEDVTELKDAHARMERLALYDELTGLPNRRFFFRELALLFEEDIQEYPSVVMLLDLDYFKTVNDTQGHSVGDQLLIQVAQRLVETLHDDDIAARLGGDEFAVLIHPVEDVDHVESVAKRILSEISRPFKINEYEIQISTSLGMAWLPKDGQTPEALLKHADLAMYQAKEMGRNQFRFFTESLHDQLQSYIRFSREMPKGLEANNFILHYQPQVDLRTNKIMSAEALVRWEHPELGLVPPLEFISIAEETGFIVPLGRWILATACQTLSELNAKGLSDIRIAINLSSRQFRDPELLRMIRDTIRKYNVNPKCLELEITETLLMQDIQLAIETLKALQAIGVTIAIDDFGIGYSSFNYLKTLPINVLKVDREFIKDIPDHLDDMEITAAIISMAHRLNMRVVAEGIETQVQQVFLEEHHCDLGQGYLFSKPVPLEQFFALLEENVNS